MSHGTGHNGYLRIRGARVHNLKNVDLDIPRNQFVVITGPSGSGKSSLAFDTIFAEGQRQYIESLSTYARQFLHQLERPDVDSIEGLQPTICIDQRIPTANPRSTVATVTEIYDYLRLLMTRLGEVNCFQCGSAIRQQTIEQIQERLMDLPAGTKLMVLAPLVRGRRGRHGEVFANVRKARFVRVRVDGVVYDIDQVPELAPRKTHTIEAVVDRIKINHGARARLAESLQLAVQYGNGVVIGCFQDVETREFEWQEELFSTLYACPQCGVSFAEIEPRTFSFNSPYGACVECDGLGFATAFDPELIIPDASLSLSEGALLPWKSLSRADTKRVREQLDPYLDEQGLSWTSPLSEYSDAARRGLFFGCGDRFQGVRTLLAKELATATNAERRQHLELFRSELPCQACHGSRLRPEANSVRVAGRTIHEITQLAISDALSFFEELKFVGPLADVATPIVTEIKNRLAFLGRVGVSYLTLARAADTLSGGELQRARLATSIGSGLVGVCYILDEPSIGLHPRDNDRLIESLRNLQRQGNTVLVVEHDEAMMRQADRLIDIGPAAGVTGGRVVAEGSPADVIDSSQSSTGRYLGGVDQIEVPSERRATPKSRSLSIEGVSTHNLKDLDVRVPLGTLVCVTGVSGSGKSSLIHETLARAVIRRLGGTAAKPGPYRSLRGATQIDKVIEIDQSPIGRTPRSNAATYSGAFDEIRKVFARLKTAKQRGFRASRFSFNVKSGRCAGCQGHGLQKIEMNFLPDLHVTCEECNGARFNRQTLSVKFHGKSIADVLEMPVDEALDFFGNVEVIRRTFESMRDVGLGYLPLGQPSTTLSGGEAQRVKMATELARVDTGHTLYLLDEPTTGLHFEDIQRLLHILTRLVDRGNTVLIIEHNLDVIKTADWIIDLGPDGGANGGELIGQGSPEEIATLSRSYTGRFLAPLLTP